MSDVCGNGAEKKITKETYFEISKKLEGKEKYGTCKSCKKVIPMKGGNTTGLKSHLKSCNLQAFEKLYSNEKKSLSTNQKTMDNFKTQQSQNIDWQRFRSCWIAYKNLPINFFDDDLTQKMFDQLNPKIKMPLRNSMRDEIMREYPKMEKNLMKILQENDSKFSFTIDAVTTKNSCSYYGITIHFIDNNFVIQALALDVVASSAKHAGKDIAQFFYKTLGHYGIQNKIQGITVDNASSNTTFIKELSILLKEDNISFVTEDQHFRCFAHILNLGVQDILSMIKVNVNPDQPLQSIGNKDEKENFDDISDSENDDLENDQTISESLVKLRSLCKKIHYSEQLNIHLKLCCTGVNEKYVKVILDVKTRWNSTYNMLNTALQMKKALLKLCETYPGLESYILQEAEWCFLELIKKLLGYFKYVCEIVSSENECTLPSAIISFNMLLDKIEQVIFQLDDKIDRNCNDEKLLLAIQNGRNKILKHYRMCNWIYCVSLILDPRYKLSGFDLTTWGRAMKEESLKKFEEIYCRNYFIQIEPVPDTLRAIDLPKLMEDSFNIESIFEEVKNVAEPWKKEINKYFEASKEPKGTNVLDWWKANSHIYPTLAKFARDLFSTQASSVSAERLFSECNLVMTDKRTSLKSDVFKALVLLHSWVKSKLREKICEIDF